MQPETLSDEEKAELEVRPFFIGLSMIRGASADFRATAGRIAAKYEALEAQVSALQEMLERRQWDGVFNARSRGRCMVCGGVKPSVAAAYADDAPHAGHRPGCALAALLGKLK